MELRDSPFPHAVIDGFLSDERFVELCDVLAGLETERKVADLFQFEQSADLTVDPALASFREALLGLQDDLVDAFGAEVSAVDAMAALYHDTDYLLPHDDRLGTRKVAYTFYLAAPDEGGRLALIRDEAPYEKTRIEPVPNRLVLFPVSERSWHEVEEVRGEVPRISVSGWYH